MPCLYNAAIHASAVIGVRRRSDGGRRVTAIQLSRSWFDKLTTNGLTFKGLGFSVRPES